VQHCGTEGVVLACRRGIGCVLQNWESDHTSHDSRARKTDTTSANTPSSSSMRLLLLFKRNQLPQRQHTGMCNRDGSNTKETDDDDGDDDNQNNRPMRPTRVFQG
jgi:hypothetical protein